MSDDGADLNMRAEGAVKAMLGGAQPERLSDADFERMIRTADDASSYDTCANVAARRVLEFLEAHPDARGLGAEADYDFSNPNSPRKVRDGLYDVMKAAGSDLDALDLTGFMWGWAVNAARHILKLPPVQNPAIVEIGR